jgi:hypothetical protein
MKSITKSKKYRTNTMSRIHSLSKKDKHVFLEKIKNKYLTHKRSFNKTLNILEYVYPKTKDHIINKLKANLQNVKSIKQLESCKNEILIDFFKAKTITSHQKQDLS